MFDVSRLSAEQRRVVLAGDGPLLVVAGPGSGKTMTLAARIAYLVAARGVTPAAVLAITFTTAAAHTLRRRLYAMLGDPGGAVDVTTFHALGLRIVRHWSDVLGFHGPPIVYGAAATRALLRQAAATVGVDLEHRPLRALATEVEHYRMGSTTTGSSRDGAGQPDGLRTLAEAYESLLLRGNGVDYPAMLTLPLRAFAAHPPALQMCQDAYRAIMADEFQDLSGAEYALLRLLGQRHRNIAVVGDPRQSLYAWRGASIRLFDDFLADFPEAQVLVLEQNFRSTGRLVALANSLGMALGYPRGLWTENPPGQEALLYAAADEEDEASFVAAEITRLTTAGAVDHLGEIAILYRTNTQAAAVIAALSARGLRYVLLSSDEDSAHTRPWGGHASPPAAATGDRVVLTTIHASKGGEWRVVFVVGVEDGLLPHACALLKHPPHLHAAAPAAAEAVTAAAVAPASPTGAASLAEELRIAYVAVTRPRERLYLTYCRTRRRGAWRQPRSPSRFIRVLPDALVRDVP